MDEKTKATAVANTDENGLQIGQEYLIISAGKTNGQKRHVRVTTMDPMVDEPDLYFSWSGYRTSFKGTYFTHDDWTGRDEFLMLDDETEPLDAQQGHDAWCGPSCVKHHFTLTSEIDQKVIVTANTLPKHPHMCNPVGGSWQALFAQEASYGKYSKSK